MIAQADEGTLGELLRDLKGFTARKILTEIKLNPQESRREWLLEAYKKAGSLSSQKQEYQFWQHCNHPEELYILMNPVEMRLVSRSEHSRLSSASDGSPLKVLPLR